jgi:hypothetical protein
MIILNAIVSPEALRLLPSTHTHTHAHRPAYSKLGHLPAHFRDQYMVLYNNCYMVLQNHNILHLLHVNVDCVTHSISVKIYRRWINMIWYEGALCVWYYNLYFILEVWSLHSTAGVGSVAQWLSGSVAQWLPVFQSIVMLSSERHRQSKKNWTACALKSKALWSFKTSGTTQPTKLCHISEDLN